MRLAIPPGETEGEVPSLALDRAGLRRDRDHAKRTRARSAADPWDGPGEFRRRGRRRERRRRRERGRRQRQAGRGWRHRRGRRDGGQQERAGLREVPDVRDGVAPRGRGHGAGVHARDHGSGAPRPVAVLFRALLQQQRVQGGPGAWLGLGALTRVVRRGRSAPRACLERERGQRRLPRTADRPPGVGRLGLGLAPRSCGVSPSMRTTTYGGSSR